MAQSRIKTVRAKPTCTTGRSFLGLFTIESWREFKRHGGHVMGFNEKKALLPKLLSGEITTPPTS